MNIIYFDCFSGVSGDMLIASLLDLGIDFEVFKQEINKLGLNLSLSWQKVNVSGISCSKFALNNPNATAVRHLPQIIAIIENSSLEPAIKAKSAEVFTKLAEAEAAVHGIAPQQVHFHEIGAVDTIVDIVGAFICLHLLEIKEIFASPLPWCQGFIDIEHGRYPLPAPATALLLKGVPCFSAPVKMELVTPTGAALITSLAASFGPMPDCTPLAIAYGAGSKFREDRVPNLLRAVMASLSSPAYTGHEIVAVLEAEVDDLNPELLGYMFERLLLCKEVLDFYTTPIIMKKNRPGFLLTVIAFPSVVEAVAGILFRETSTLGVRHRLQTRSTLPRHYEDLQTPWGMVGIKVAHLPDGEVRMKPEFEDCRLIAVTHKIPLQDVYATVTRLLHINEGANT